MTFKSDEQIHAEYEGVIVSDPTRHGEHSGGMQLTFPNGAEDMFENFIRYDNGTFGWDNWYPDPIYEILKRHATTILHGPYFDEFGNFLGVIPSEAVVECTFGGRDSFPWVSTWVNKLDFMCPRELALKYLREFGAWDDLDTVDSHTIDTRVFWTACNDIHETGEWFGLSL